MFIIQRCTLRSNRDLKHSIITESLYVLTYAVMCYGKQNNPYCFDDKRILATAILTQMLECKSGFRHSPAHLWLVWHISASRRGPVNKRHKKVKLRVMRVLPTNEEKNNCLSLLLCQYLLRHPNIEKRFFCTKIYIEWKDCANNGCAKKCYYGKSERSNFLSIMELAPREQILLLLISAQLIRFGGHSTSYTLVVIFPFLYEKNEWKLGPRVSEKRKR